MSNLPSPQTDPPSQGADHTILWTLILLSICASCMLSFLIPYWVNPAQGSVFIPVSILAKRNANYQADLLQATIPPLDASILQAVLRDNDPQATDIVQRMATLQEVISEPVPTATPVLQPTPQSASTQKVLPGQGSGQPTLSEVIPTSTGTSQGMRPTPTHRATLAIPTATSTLQPTFYATDTATTMPPANTPTPTSLPPQVFTATATTTNTPLPTPTDKHPPKPTHAPKPTQIPKPTHIPPPTHIPRPTHIPPPTHIPKPTHIPPPTQVPKPTHSR